LLLACASVADEPARMDRVRSLLPLVSDWDRVLLLARRHGLLPLVTSTVGRVGEADVSGPRRASLVQAGTAAGHRALLLTRELLRILDGLEANGIDAMPYNGPALAQRLYGSVAARSYVDLDVLVRERDVERVAEALAPLGYSPVHSLHGRALRAQISSNSELKFLSTGEEGGASGVLLEIQWRIAPAYMVFGLEMDTLWQRASVAPFVGNTQIRTLDDADLFLVLCFHGAKHLWARLGWVRDVAQFVAVTPNLDWERLHQRAVYA
jgi:hypothetical protein